MDFIKKLLSSFPLSQFLTDTFDTTQPLWERLGNMVIFLGFTALIIGIILVNIAPESGIGQQIGNIGGPLVFGAITSMVFIIILIETKRFRRSNPNGTGNRFITIFYGTVVFVLLPCLLLTAIMLLVNAFLQ